MFAVREKHPSDKEKQSRENQLKKSEKILIPSTVRTSENNIIPMQISIILKEKTLGFQTVPVAETWGQQDFTVWTQELKFMSINCMRVDKG